MAASCSDIDVDDLQITDAVHGTSESENELDMSRGRKILPKLEELAKKKHNLDQTYLSYKTKKDMPACAVGNRCHGGYFQKVIQAGVRKIFCEFWKRRGRKGGNIIQQSTFSPV